MHDSPVQPSTQTASVPATAAETMEVQVGD
jgi:hypothetical protein